MRSISRWLHGHCISPPFLSFSLSLLLSLSPSLSHLRFLFPHHSQHSSLYYPHKIPHNLRLESHYAINYRVDLQRPSASQKLIPRIHFGETLKDGCLSYGRVLSIYEWPFPWDFGTLSVFKPEKMSSRIFYCQRTAEPPVPQCLMTVDDIVDVTRSVNMSQQ